MTFRIIIVILFLPSLLYSQHELQLFEYYLNDVKSVQINNESKRIYKYSNGTISENQGYIWGLSERIVFYNEVGIIDSTVFIETYADTAYYYRRKFIYDEHSRLVKVQDVGDPMVEILTIDSFIYDSNGRLDLIIVYGNSSSNYLGTKRADKYSKTEKLTFEYDEEGVVKSMESLGEDKELYFYNIDGELERRIKYSGFTKIGCLLESNQLYFESHYKYNELGLIEKEVVHQILVKPGGRKRIRRFRYKYRYEFY